MFLNLKNCLIFRDLLPAFSRRFNVYGRVLHVLFRFNFLISSTFHNLLKRLMNLCLHQPSRISTADRFRHQGCFFIQKHTHTFHAYSCSPWRLSENISVTLNDDDTSSAELWLWYKSRINSAVMHTFTLLFLDRRLEGPEPQGNYFMLTAQLRPRCEFTNTKCSSGYGSLFRAAGITRGWDTLAVWDCYWDILLSTRGKAGFIYLWYVKVMIYFRGCISRLSQQTSGENKTSYTNEQK